MVSDPTTMTGGCAFLLSPLLLLEEEEEENTWSATYHYIPYA